jgi:hypothetical protein
MVETVKIVVDKVAGTWWKKAAIAAGVLAMIVLVSYCAGRGSRPQPAAPNVSDILNQNNEAFHENYKPPVEGREDDYINNLADHLRVRDHSKRD